MSIVEASATWEVMRRFIPPRLAEAAGAQALMLCGFAEEGFIDSFTPPAEVGGSKKLSVQTVSVPEFTRWPLAVAFPDLVEVYELSEQIAQNGLDEFFINHYGPGGHTAPHRDTYPGAGATVAVGLWGEAEVRIHDPEKDQWHAVHLAAGDALYMEHVPNEADRPLHSVRNPLPTRRIALVNG